MSLRKPFTYATIARAFKLFIVTATLACGNNVVEPDDNKDPGFVRVSVTGPVTPDVAFKIRITGGAVDSVRVVSGSLYFETLGPLLHRAIVIDSPDRTRLLEFWIADRNKLDSLGVNLEEIAATGTYEQRPVSDYVAIIGR